nr:MAG TPA: hypothetical protein [Caudoviricetes sp.]
MFVNGTSEHKHCIDGCASSGGKSVRTDFHIV